MFSTYSLQEYYCYSCVLCLFPRDTKKGDKFAIWKLSDLSGQTSLISVFLFGKAYQEHWKTPLGHVVALLNPSIMPSREVCVRECVYA